MRTLSQPFCLSQRLFVSWTGARAWRVWTFALLALVGAAQAQVASSSLTYYSGVYEPSSEQLNKACVSSLRPGADRAGYVPSRAKWFCLAGNEGFPITDKDLCWNVMGRDANDRTGQNIHAVTRELPEGKVALQCLFSPVTLDCVRPTSSVPTWPMPKFSTANDERCDPWRRGPEPASVSSSPIDGDKNQFLELSQMLGPYLRYQLPRRADMVVRSAFWNDKGERVGPVPAVRLETLIRGRPTIAVQWKEGCSKCDDAINALYGSMRFYMKPHKTDHHDARLVILLQYENDQITSLQMKKLWQRYPGATVWPVVSDLDYTGLEAPYVHVFDRHGFLRTILPGNDLRENSDAWYLLSEPYALLNLSLRDAVWRRPSREVKFEEVVRQARAGRMPLSVAEAPDVISVQPEIATKIAALVKDPEASKREFGSWIMTDNDRVWLSTIKRGYELSFYPDSKELETLVRAASEKNVVKSVGTFHTHPLNGIFSSPDIRGAKGEISLLGMVGDYMMVAIPTYEGLRTMATVNLGLEDPRFYPSQVSWFLNRFYLGGTMLSSPLMAGRLSAQSELLEKWTAESKPLEEVAQVAQFGAQQAQREGVALYLGRTDGRLRKIDVRSNVDRQLSWTGNSSPSQHGQETGLTRADRVVIAGIVRAIQGDKDAFCRVWPADLQRNWSPEVRQAIRDLPRLRARYFPNAPPMQVSDSGFLNDTDMLAMLEIAYEVIDFEEGSFVVQDNRDCVATILKIQDDRQMHVRVGKAIVRGDGDGGRRTRRLEPDVKGGQGYAIYFGEDAVTLGCESIAIVSKSGDRCVREQAN